MTVLRFIPSWDLIMLRFLLNKKQRKIPPARLIAPAVKYPKNILYFDSGAF